MTENVLQVWPEIFAVVAGVLVLFVFALAIAIKQKPDIHPGSSGHRKDEELGEDEEIRPDGYIDSFAKVIEEAGGGLTLIVKIAIVGVLLWWLIYLILFWQPR
jgi:hypothetical protein